MAFVNQIRWMAHFRGPDGLHIMTGYASTKEMAAQGFRQTLSTNKELSLDVASIRPAGDTDIDRAEAELRAADPSRPLANDLGLDTPNRILHEPWVLPGSQVAPPEPAAAE